MTDPDLVLENDLVRFDVAIEDGFSLKQVTDKRTETKFLSQSAYFDGTPFSFQIAWNEGEYEHYPASKFAVASATTESRDDQTAANVRLAVADSEDFSLNVKIILPSGSALAEWQITVEGDVTGQFQFPDLPVVIDGARPEWGLIPTELGVSGEIGEDAGWLGTPESVFNAMQYGVVSTGPNDPGLAVVNRLPGATDIHLQVDSDGRFRGKQQYFDSRNDEKQRIASALVGPVQDWQDASTAYLNTSEAERPATPPAWLREAGGLYGFDGGGAGSIYLGYPMEGGLPGQIDSFAELPDLLEDARQFGTDLVYLWDYWDGNEDDCRHSYSNKGNYFPRTDGGFGGEDEFREGVAAIQERGGKVVVYVEPFIASYHSDVGLAHGPEWSLKDASGAYQTHYHKQWSMCPAADGWQEHMADVAKRLVGDYGVDGIYLDSYGLQWNRVCHDTSHGHEPSEQAYNEGTIELIERVRNAVREIQDDAVVMTESFNDRLATVTDAGIDGSFFWGFYNRSQQPPLNRSPIKRTFPEIQAFSGGKELTHLHQAFAAGQGFALSPYWSDESEHIRRLLEVRRDYADALIDGKLGAKPELSSEGAVAYRHLGDESSVLVVATTDQDEAWNGDLSIGQSAGATIWRDVLQDRKHQADQTGTIDLRLDTGPEGVAVLVAEE